MKYFYLSLFALTLTLQACQSGDGGISGTSLDSNKTNESNLPTPNVPAGSNTEIIEKYEVSLELRQDIDSIQYYLFDFQRHDKQTPQLYAKLAVDLERIFAKTELQVKADPKADPRINTSLQQMKSYSERLKSDNFDEALKMYGFITQEFSLITQITKQKD